MQKVLLSLMVLCSLNGCQADPGVTPASTPANTPATSIPGGYSSRNTEDPAMLEVFREAEKLLQAKYPDKGLTLSALRTISSQVVAGANYRIEADYKDNKGTGVLRLIVFRSLEGQYSLSDDSYLNP